VRNPRMRWTSARSRNDGRPTVSDTQDDTRNRTKMGSLVPGHQGTGALGPGPKAFFYFILFFILGSFEFNQFHQSKL
jgi:hypothetical protein